MYTKNQKSQTKKNLSSVYVEIQQDFLQEPLILTILLDCKATNESEKKTYHLSIEKEPKHSTSKESAELASYLFGGNKGYNWLTSFLHLLHSIKYTNANHVRKQPNHLLMTQNMLKLLTILSNLLISNLLRIDSGRTFKFVEKLQGLLEQNIAQSLDDLSTPSNEASSAGTYDEIKLSITKDEQLQTRAKDAGSRPHEEFIMTFGLNLLLELCFIFIVQCKSAVMPASLRPWILQEYGKILASLVQSDGSF